MERGFYNDEFEELIKQKADQYKMYPSDHVWKGIHRSLHTRKKWYGASFLLFLGGITYYAIVQLLSPSSGAPRKPATNINPATASNAAALAANNKQAVIIPLTPRVKQTPDENTIPGQPSSFVVNPDRVYPQPSAVTIASVDPAAEAARETAGNETTAEAIRNGDKAEQAKSLIAKRLTTITIPPHQNTLPQATSVEGNTLIGTVIDPLADMALAPEEKVSTPEKPVPFDEAAAEDAKQIGWLQQYASYEVKIPKTRRLSWQLSFSPTINYRKLKSGSDAFTADIKNLPMPSSASGDPDKLVNHKPALGFELGSHFFYAVNKTLQIKVGAQFNYSRYAIQAYGSYQSDVATIALNSATPGGRPADSITNFTRIRNFGGDMSEDIYNQYYQLSLPVGLQARLVGSNKIFIGVAGTIMPTWLINRNTYLITTDFKNYTKEPSLVRPWNVNTSAEIFLAYKTGDLQWQVGPQFRYQLFSSYVQEYPIREYLMEYGIKIGVTKTIR